MSALLMAEPLVLPDVIEVPGYAGLRWEQQPVPDLCICEYRLVLNDELLLAVREDPEGLSWSTPTRLDHWNTVFPPDERKLHTQFRGKSGQMVEAAMWLLQAQVLEPVRRDPWAA